jgi:hypothetical protein
MTHRNKQLWNDPESKKKMLAKRKATRAANKVEKKRQEDELRRQMLMEHTSLGCEILAQRHAVQDFEDQAPIRQAFSTLTGRTLHTEDEIVSASVEMPSTCGVYFLVHEHRVVYVGQSVNILARVGSHKASRKVFDRVAFVTCAQEHLNVVESLYIHILRPPLNGDSNTKGLKAAPISMDELLSYLSPAYALARSGTYKIVRHYDPMA